MPFGSKHFFPSDGLNSFSVFLVPGFSVVKFANLLQICSFLCLWVVPIVHRFKLIDFRLSQRNIYFLNKRQHIMMCNRISNQWFNRVCLKMWICPLFLAHLNLKRSLDTFLFSFTHNIVHKNYIANICTYVTPLRRNLDLSGFTQTLQSFILDLAVCEHSFCFKSLVWIRRQLLSILRLWFQRFITTSCLLNEVYVDIYW